MQRSVSLLLMRSCFIESAILNPIKISLRTLDHVPFQKPCGINGFVSRLLTVKQID